jgi:hypothetical protein
MVVIELEPVVTVLFYLSLAAGIANVCLLLLLLKTYWKTYKEIKSHFTIGLMYFGSFLLIQNIFVTLGLMVHLLVDVVPNSLVSNLGPPTMLSIINIIQLIALSILYRISKK